MGSDRNLVFNFNKMITALWQKDVHWKNHRIGDSMATLGQYGCYIMCLCMALEKLRGYPCDPRDAVRYWKFTAQGLLSSKTRFKGMRIALKASYYNRIEVAKYANASNKAAILVLDYGKHYVYVEKVDGSVTTYIDPWTGKRCTTLDRKITGMRLYEATAIPTPEWMEKFIKKAKEKGLDISDPLEKANIAKIEEILFDLGIIKEKKGHITIGRLLVMMEKIKNLW